MRPAPLLLHPRDADALSRGPSAFATRSLFVSFTSVGVRGRQSFHFVASPDAIASERCDPTAGAGRPVGRVN